VSAPLAAAAGRVLAAPFAAPEDLPRDRRSVMDGYAVHAADLASATQAAPVPLRVTGQVPMGGIFAGAVGLGEAAAIATGGVVPSGADAVAMVETTVPLDGARIAVRKRIDVGANVVQPGEDFARGAIALPAGRRLRAADVGLLATFGVGDVEVFRRPRVALLSSGNELCPSDATPRPGQVRESNQIALATQVAAAGGEPTLGGIVADDLDALRAAIARLLPGHDALMLSGGSSIGVKDLSALAFADLPAPGILFHGIDIRPGKPTLFGRAGAKPVIGMPGFPTSSLVVFDAFIRPLLHRMRGEPDRDPWPARRAARLAHPLRSVLGREDYVRVRIERTDGGALAWPLTGGSATMANVVLADGIVRIDAALVEIPAGETVEVLLYQ
jgi:molybdopterin molybdotransferase